MTHAQIGLTVFAIVIGLMITSTIVLALNPRHTQGHARFVAWCVWFSWLTWTSYLMGMAVIGVLASP